MICHYLWVGVKISETNFRKYLFEPAMIQVVRCRCLWFAFKISIHFGQLRSETQQQWPDQHMERFLQLLLLLSYANTRIILNENIWAGNIPGLTTCWNACKENKNWKTHPSPSHGAFRPVFASLVEPFRAFFYCCFIPKVYSYSV